MSNFKDLLVPNFTLDVINSFIKEHNFDFSKVVTNLNIALQNIDKFVSNERLGICGNYMYKFKSDVFYYISSFVARAILKIQTEWPIPYIAKCGVWEGENLENRIAYMAFIRDFLIEVNKNVYKDPANYVGRMVTKDKKPFKSSNKCNTIKGIINHPTLNVPCFTFEDDDSYVECSRCKFV